jgi:hypothetical protein
VNLYEINHEIMSCWDEETGEILDVQKFDAMQMALEDKLEGIGCYIKNLEAEAAALKTEEQAFATRRKRAENKVASLKNYLAGYLQGCPFETLRVKVSFRKSESLEVSESAVIPEEYLRYKDPEVDKAELKKAVKAGLVLDGVQLVQKQNISIK